MKYEVRVSVEVWAKTHGDAMKLVEGRLLSKPTPALEDDMTIIESSVSEPRPSSRGRTR